MLAMLISGSICEQFPFFSPTSWSCIGCYGVAPRLIMVPHAHRNDRSDRFHFRVKGGLVIELLFWGCLKDSLGSFVGWLIFIFSPSPLSST